MTIVTLQFSTVVEPQPEKMVGPLVSKLSKFWKTACRMFLKPGTNFVDDIWRLLTEPDFPRKIRFSGNRA